MQLNRRALHTKDPKLVPSRRRKEKSQLRHHWGSGYSLCPLHPNIPRWNAHSGTIVLATLLLQKSVVSGKDTLWKDRYFINFFLLSILHINPSSPFLPFSHSPTYPTSQPPFFFGESTMFGIPTTGRTKPLPPYQGGARYPTHKEWAPKRPGMGPGTTARPYPTHTHRSSHITATHIQRI